MIGLECFLQQISGLYSKIYICLSHLHWVSIDFWSSLSTYLVYFVLFWLFHVLNGKFCLSVSVPPPALWRIQEYILHYCVLHLSRSIPFDFDVVAWLASIISLSLQCRELNNQPIGWILLQFLYANYTNPKYKTSGRGLLKLQLINQRADFSFALFTGGLSNVCTGFFFNCFIV